MKSFYFSSFEKYFKKSRCVCVIVLLEIQIEMQKPNVNRVWVYV